MAKTDENVQVVKILKSTQNILPLLVIIQTEGCL